jgi:hypothetical protein
MDKIDESSFCVFTCIFLNDFSNLYQAADYPQRRYRIVLRSTMGPVDVYLVRYH